MSEFTALPERFELVIEMRSDWHVGTGAGRSRSVDRLVARDDEGFPHVPGKTLTGILRDACELAVQALDVAPGSGWAAVLAYVFGDQPGLATAATGRAPGGAALSIRSARLAGPVRRALGDPLRGALTFVKPGVAIAAGTGRALDKALRFFEMTRGGCTLRADTRMDPAADLELALASSALLCAGAALVDRLGGGRRRGAGRCSITVNPAPDPEALIAWLRDHPVAPAVARADETPAATDSIGASGDWLDMGLDIRLRSPLLVSTEVVGNVVRGLDYVPGRVLLPLLARRCRELGVDVTAAVAEGSLRVLAARPVVEGERAAPMPLIYGRPKVPGESDRLVPLARLEQDERDGRRNYPHKQARGGYVVGGAGGAIVWLLPKLPLHVHNSVRDATQRPEEAGVYSHTAMPAGTRLRAVVRLRADIADRLAASDPCWWERLDREESLGKSRKDDYGLVKVRATAPAAAEFQLHAIPAGGRLDVWCLSDIVLRDELLEPVTSSEGLRRDLEARLGVRLQPTAGGARLRTGRIDAWQATWGLPRPSLATIAAGSVVSFTAAERIEEARLAEVALAGIGERRAEGLGEVALLNPLADVERNSDGVPFRWPDGEGLDDTASAGGTPGPADVGFLRVVEREWWRDRLRVLAVARGADPEFRRNDLGWPDDLPGSQRGALREVVRHSAAADPQSPASTWLHRLEAVPERAAKWRRPGTGAPDALAVLERLLTEPSRVWDLLFAGEEPVTPHAYELRGELWQEAVTLLVDECARRHGGDDRD